MPALTRLKTLVFYGHNLRDLPVGFRDLKSLEMVDLGDGRLRQVPRVLAEFPRLRKLRLARNTIGKAPNPKEELSFLASLPALEELDLSTNAFSPALKSQLAQRFSGIRVEG
jgi:Leucine-rich repeat (LRR) protein